MLTRYILPIATAAGTLMLSSVGSQALPMAKPSAAPLPIESVGWRCGPGWHVNRWGNCVPNHRVIVRPYRYYHPGYRHYHYHRWHHRY
ncbi:GCG_CRPN prefix-to-repeats domain-containing protein [Mesorhizobium shangrilense]|uniref:GCG_CRPN prefix-to-repeats domain-containing protein n=1 Tax=Mesorhizobium shangrilense TaxID=460060 RepID=UPI003F496AEB